MPEFHPIANIFPLLAGADFDALVADIRANGLREAIWRYRDGRIIDGRNRWRACQAAGVKCTSRTFEGEDHEILPFVISQNLHRRHLDASQRAMIAAQLAAMSRGGDRGNQHTGGKPSIGGMPAEQAAELLNVGTRSVERARTVLASRNLTLISAVRHGEVSVSEAVEITKAVLPEVHAKADKVFSEEQRYRRIEREERRRAFVEECRKKLRQKKIEEARATAEGGIIPLPDVTQPIEKPEQPVSHKRLYAKLWTFLRQDPMSPEEAAGVVPAQYREGFVERAQRRQAWLSEFIRLLGEPASR